MKHRAISLLLLALVSVGVEGCASTSRQNRNTASNRPRSFALAVTVNRALQPTPQQWATIQAKFASVIAERGWVLVTDLSLADHIVRIDFTPDAEDPETNGRAKVLWIRNNPKNMVARQGTGPLPGAFGYASSMSSMWPYSNYYPGSYYGYGDFYNDGYTSGWSTVTTPVSTTPTPSPTHPPYRHTPGNRDDCPPEHSLRPMPAFVPTFVANTSSTYSAARQVADHARPPPSDYRSSSSDRSHGGRSDRSGSDRSYSSYSRNDSGYSRSDYSSSNYSSYSSSSPDYSSSMSSSASTSSSAASSAAAATVSSSAASEPITVISR
jgi:hypothetical protein